MFIRIIAGRPLLVAVELIMRSRLIVRSYMWLFCPAPCCIKCLLSSTLNQKPCCWIIINRLFNGNDVGGENRGLF
jgi:hypothetical protein